MGMINEPLHSSAYSDDNMRLQTHTHMYYPAPSDSGPAATILSTTPEAGKWHIIYTLDILILILYTVESCDFALVHKPPPLPPQF